MSPDGTELHSCRIGRFCGIAFTGQTLLRPATSESGLGQGLFGGDGSSGVASQEGFERAAGALQIPPLRCAPVGMTRGEG